MPDQDYQLARTRTINAALNGANPEQHAIAETGLEIVAMLLNKNRQYGSSAFAPARIFSKAGPVEQLLVRADDKLSRIRAGAADDDEDPILDLAGYLILIIAARRETT